MIATVFKRYTTLLILIALLCVFSLLSPQFLTSLNLKNLLVVQVTVCCMAFATILPLIVGEFDLSLGYALGFIMMLGAFLGGFGFSAATIIPAMLAAGACIGAINGLLRISFNISSFIVTLGVGIVLSGVTQGMSGGAVLYSGIPPILTAIGQHELLGFKISVWFTIGLALVLVFVLEHTPFGRQLYAIGGSERVALLAGNPCQSVQSAGVRGSRVACERCGPIRARPKRRRQSAVRARTASACLCRRFSRRHDISARLFQHTGRSHRYRAPGRGVQRSEFAGRPLLALRQERAAQTQGRGGLAGSGASQPRRGRLDAGGGAHRARRGSRDPRRRRGRQCLRHGMARPGAASCMERRADER